MSTRTEPPAALIVATYATDAGAWLASARVAANSDASDPILTEVQRWHGRWAVVAVWDRDVEPARAILRRFVSTGRVGDAGEVLS